MRCRFQLFQHSILTNRLAAPELRASSPHFDADFPFDFDSFSAIFDF
jgi:hypothetical protein